jgi:hypothetical protein
MTCPPVVVPQSEIKPEIVCKGKSSSFPWILQERHSAHYLRDTTSFIQSTQPREKAL